MDRFREEQKKMCFDASPSPKARYGCPCCRDLSNLRDFKKYSRRIAKHRLRNQDRLDFKNVE